jgi:hypothetical protein
MVVVGSNPTWFDKEVPAEGQPVNQVLLNITALENWVPPPKICALLHTAAASTTLQKNIFFIMDNGLKATRKENLPGRPVVYYLYCCSIKTKEEWLLYFMPLVLNN